MDELVVRRVGGDVADGTQLLFCDEVVCIDQTRGFIVLEGIRHYGGLQFRIPSQDNGALIDVSYLCYIQVMCEGDGYLFETNRGVALVRWLGYKPKHDGFRGDGLWRIESSSNDLLKELVDRFDKTSET